MRDYNKNKVELAFRLESNSINITFKTETMFFALYSSSIAAQVAAAGSWKSFAEEEESKVFKGHCDKNA